MRCPYCGSTRIILDTTRGEYICTNCGTVIAEHLPDTSHEEHRFHTYGEYIEKARTAKVDPIFRKLGTVHKRREKILLGEKTDDTYREKVLRACELLSLALHALVGIEFNLLHHTHDIIHDTYICEKEYCKNLPTRAVVFGLGIHMFRMVKKRDIPLDKLSRIAREMKVGKYLLQALSCTKKYIDAKYGKNSTLLLLLEEALKHIDEEHRPTIRKIVARLIEESNILKTIYKTRKHCAIYVLTAVIAEKLLGIDVTPILEEAAIRGLCSKYTCREMYRKMRRHVQINLI